MPLDESKKDFWDSFAEAGAARQTGGGAGSSAIGTGAVKKSSASGGAAKGKLDEDNWDKW